MLYGKPENLLDKLFNYIQSTKDEKLELKPNEFNENTQSFESKFEQMNETIIKDKNSIITNENKIICDNIIEKFFSLNNEKFLACMKRMIEWDFETCMREFILNYYLYIKHDNKLRNYIALHMNTILTILSERIERKLIESIKLFNFSDNTTDHEVELLKNDLKNKETILLGVEADNFNDYAPANDEQKEKLDERKKKDYRTEIINRLKYENPELEKDL